MHIGAILPHLQCFGGVRRFLELGNSFIKRGYEYTIFSNKEQKCTWFDFKGKICDWSEIKADYILIADPPSFKILSKVRGKIFVYVIAGGHFIDKYKSVYGKYPFILNNRVFKKYFPKSYLVEGGVNIKKFTPRKRKVLFYDTDRAIKGASYIKEQLSDLENLELIGLKGLNDKQIADAYKEGDYFVSWENREGWSNTSAEALASGLTVVTNGVGCEPFQNKVIIVKDLRKFFTSPMEEFDWTYITSQLLEIFKKEDDND